MRLLLHWILSALAMLLVAHYVPGFTVTGFVPALIAAAVYGLVNATLGLVLKVLTFPLSILTFGLFLLVINALMLQFAAALLPGIEVDGFWPAFWLTSSARWPPEWDIFEIVNGVIFGYTHPAGGICAFVDGAAGGDATYTIPDVYDTYHVYGFKWTSSDLYWYVDGVTTEHYAVSGAGEGDPFWLNLSLQVGGDWPGDPDGTTPLPSSGWSRCGCRCRTGTCG